ncbi:MAG: DUF167 domain-containing protein [Candidatus Rokubacteria bacterium]|nr:DUF167 domain-containing protein [Candidatus Rokubacteria bacterium]
MKGPQRADSTLLHVRVQPRSSATEVIGWDGNTLRIRVTAPPLADRANRAVVDLLARALLVPRAQVHLVRGAHGRDKLIRIAGISRDLLEARLAARRVLG